MRAAEQGPEILATKTVPDVDGASIVNQPLGVLLAIEPWNFPYLQVARVLGPNLMAGNVLVVKHAPNVPQCALALQGLFKDGGAPDGLYTNLFIDDDTADKLIADPRIKGVTVTGSERAGRIIAAEAGKQLKKIVLELGGSDPFIVLEDAPMETALDHAAFARMEASGQSCVAGKRFIVVGKERGEAFLSGLTSRFEGLKVGDPADQATQLGPISSEAARDGLIRQIDAATAAGARVVTGGKAVDRAGFFLEPTIITDIDEQNPIRHQEVFGPVASVYVVADDDAAVEVANDSPFGLGGMIYSADTERAVALAERVDSGMLFINNPTAPSPRLPFGGVKNSGHGRELSDLGFKEFVNPKLIRVFPSGAAIQG